MSPDPMIEHVLMSLNPAGWIHTLGLLPFFPSDDPTLTFEGIQVTKERSERTTVHVRTKRNGLPDVFGPTTVTATRQFRRTALGWEEVK